MENIEPTIGMVTYNRLELTKKTFETTLRRTGCNYNLIVIDNNSEDGSIEWMLEEVEKIKEIKGCHIIKLKENKGIAYGRNMCLKVTDDKFPETTHICTLDNDVELQENWLLDCCRIINSNKSIAGCGVNFEDTSYPRTKLKLDDGEIYTVQIKPVGNLGTACAVFPYELHRKIGFFSTQYQYYGHEDALWGFITRLATKGQLVYLDTPGLHLGVGESDAGEYREMKNKYWDINIVKFNRDCALYSRGMKSLYTNFDNYDESVEDWVK